MIICLQYEIDPFSRLSHATRLLLIFIAVSAVSHAVVINKLLAERMAAE